MTKRITEPASGSDKAKVRVVFAQIEGSNETVQEAFRSIAAAMGRPATVIFENPSNGKPPSLLDRRESELGLDPIEAIGEEDAQVEENTSETGRKVRGTGKKLDRNAGLALVPDLNFRPEGKDSLKNFLSEKAPRNDLETILAFVYYMQHNMGLVGISRRHVKTAFKEVGKPIPVDLTQTIRNLKNRKAWLKFSNIDDIQTTTQGENLIEHEMPKGGKD